jgi:hypothetical protein
MVFLVHMHKNKVKKGGEDLMKASPVWGSTITFTKSGNLAFNAVFLNWYLYQNSVIFLLPDNFVYL